MGVNERRKMPLAPSNAWLDTGSVKVLRPACRLILTEQTGHSNALWADRKRQIAVKLLMFQCAPDLIRIP